MKKSDVVPLGQLVEVRAQRPSRDMRAIVYAAKLLVDGAKGKEAFFSGEEDLLHIFNPVPLPRGIYGLTVVDATGFIFADDITQYRLTSDKLVPYLIIKLCNDLFDFNGSPALYNADGCGYAIEKDKICITLSKSIDYCSYHNISVSFGHAKWEVSIEGCWRGSHQDPGPVYHPEANSYFGRLRGHGSIVSQSHMSGKDIEKAFALWGIDVALLGIDVAPAEAIA